MASNQHYVPRFLLRNFCAGARPRIWAYDKSTGRSFETSVDNVAVERNFYDAKIGDSTLSLEEGLSNLESRASVIIDRIVDDRSIGGLSGDDRIEIATFVATQMLRGPNNREHVKALGEAVRGTLAERGVDQESIERLLPDLSQDEAKALALMSLRSVETFAQHIINKSWLLFETDPAVPLYISDNPVGLQNLVEQATPLTGNLGLAVVGIEMYLPIASTLSLGFYCGSHERVIRDGVERFRISTIRSPDLPIPHFAELLKWRRAFRTGVALDLDPDNVLNQNSLQVRQAERYVYSSLSDFSLVEDMIANQPGYRKGPRPRVV